jgi:hypothetical protein
MDDTDPLSTASTIAIDSTDTPFPFPAADTGVLTYTNTYSVSFGTGTRTSAKFKLIFDGTPFTGTGDYSFLDYVALEVTYFSPTGLTFSSGSAVQTLLRVTETVRNDILRVVYVSDASQVFHFALFPVIYDSGAGAVEANMGITSYDLTLSSSGALDDNHWALTKTGNVKYTDSAGTSAAPFSAGNSI